MFQQEVRLVLLWNTKGVTRLRFQVKCPCGRRKRLSRWLTNPKETVLWTWWFNRSNDDAYSVAPYHSNIITQRLASNIYKGWAAERSLNSQPQREFCFLHARMMMLSYVVELALDDDDEATVLIVRARVFAGPNKKAYHHIYIVVANCLRCTPVPGIILLSVCTGSGVQNRSWVLI